MDHNLRFPAKSKSHSTRGTGSIFSCLVLLLILPASLYPVGNVRASSSRLQISSKPVVSQIVSDPPPATIRVRITGQARCDTSLPYTVKTLNFYDYLRHVLPNEWLYTWDRESLRAGAIAVKMYAWYWIERGGKWPDADLYDSACDQVYNPNITHASTDQALRATWNWKLTQDGEIFQAAYLHVCRSARCLDQVQSQRLALGGYTWDEILEYYYPGSQLALIRSPEFGFALQYSNAHPGDIQIPLTDREASLGVNVGASDFTLEWWLKAKLVDYRKNGTICTSTSDWRQGAALFDRSSSGQAGQYGVAILNSKLAVGLVGPQGDRFTLCGDSPITDGRWHHLAVQRSAVSGQVWIFVDGHLDASGSGPSGDISFSGEGATGLSIDHILAIGGTKTYTGSIPPQFQGWLDEIRFSDILRYSPSGFKPPEDFFIPDEYTTALYHLNEGYGRDVLDASGWSLGSSDGFRSDPTSSGGVEWVESDLFAGYHLFLPSVTVGK